MSDEVKTKQRLRFSLRALLFGTTVAGILVAIGADRLREYLNERSRVVPAVFDVRTGKNLLWSAKAGSQSFVGPIVHRNHVYVGTNNEAGYIKRYPNHVDLGVLLCFDAADGKLLWQASNKKLVTGRVHDWPLLGITSTPAFEGDRLWYVTNRCEVVCLDTEGFHDGEDDGDPFELRTKPGSLEADTVWKLDMMNELGVRPHNMSASSPCLVGDKLFLVTGNGVDESHVNIKDAHPPSFIALDKRTGKLLWSDASPGINILHGQWGSPTYGVIRGVPQVIFPGGDGWLYSFDPDGNADGSSKLLWKFDCNPKDSVWKLGGAGTRNNLIAAPTIHNNLVYMTVGQNPEHGEGPGRVVCIDPTKRGDVSSELVFNKNSPNQPIPHKRLQACDKTAGDFTRPNPNSALVWEYTGTDLDGDGKSSFDEEMHRSLSWIVIKDDLLFVTDFSGLFHCLDAKTGRAHWTYDLFAHCYSTPVLSADHVFVTDEDGDIDVFAISSDPKIAFPGNNPVASTMLLSSAYATPMIHKNVLYLQSQDTVYAIADPSQ